MKCKTPECPNDSSQGMFIGKYCVPCHEFMLKGIMNRSQACMKYKKEAIATTIFMVKIRGMRHMTRFQNNPRIMDNNVAEHTCYVGLYTLNICNILGVDENIKCAAIEYALLHDVHEGISVEIPANVKRICKNPAYSIEDRAIKEVFNGMSEYIQNLESRKDDEVIAIVKLADLIDALAYVSEEIHMGNKFFNIVALEIKGAICKLVKDVGEYYGSDSIHYFKNRVFDAFGIGEHHVSEVNMKSMTHIEAGFKI